MADLLMVVCLLPLSSMQGTRQQPTWLCQVREMQEPFKPLMGDMCKELACLLK